MKIGPGGAEVRQGVRSQQKEQRPNVEAQACCVFVTKKKVKIWKMKRKK